MNNKLKARHKEEILFHDQKVTKKQHKDFYAVEGTDLAYQAMIEAAGDLTGKKVLDFGCGEGWASLDYARRQAGLVVGFDISGESLQSALRLLQTEAPDKKVLFIRSAAEQLGLGDDLFDLVLGNAILHHTDLAATIAEIRRVLKPGGKAIFVEPLGHNPLLRFFRLLTPWRRSKYEKPITMAEFESISKEFSTFQLQGYYLLSMMALGLFFMHRNEKFLQRSLSILAKTDTKILGTFPALNKYCFAGVFILVA